MWTLTFCIDSQKTSHSEIGECFSLKSFSSRGWRVGPNNNGNNSSTRVTCDSSANGSSSASRMSTNKYPIEKSSGHWGGCTSSECIPTHASRRRHCGRYGHLHVNVHRRRVQWSHPIRIIGPRRAQFFLRLLRLSCSYRPSPA